jgi:hypothetical protein
MGTVMNLYLNSYDLKTEGSASIFRLLKAEALADRRDLQRSIGVRVWIEDSNVFAYQKPSGQDAEESQFDLRRSGQMGMFVLREALLEHCQALGFEAWIARAGEIRIMGVTPPSDTDLFRVEHVLHVRIGREETAAGMPVLTARHRTSWRCIDDLSDPKVASFASRQWAVRLSGEGPARGRVVGVGGDSAVLEVGPEEVEVNAADYTLSVNAALVANWRGSSVLRQIRVNAGDLTVRGKRNRHGIEDRFKRAGQAVRALGGEFPVRGQARVRIEKSPVQVRLEGPA